MRPGRPRPRGLILLAILAWLACAPARAAGLPAAVDLAADARHMREQRLPMLLFFSRAGCPWCERARREYLAPLAADPATRALVREVETGADAPLTDFAGHATTQRAFAATRGVKMVPAIHFLGPDGEALAEPIVGFGIADFYGGQIDDGLAAARDRLAKDAK